MSDDSLKAKALARSVVPDAWLRERTIYLRLGDPAGRIYAGMRLREKMGMKLPTANVLALPMRSAVFVCYGNIMRSPMAAEMMKREISIRNLTPAIQVHSAGLHASPGNPAHPWAIAAGHEIGMPLTEHRATELSGELALQAGAIFAMDFQNAAELLARFPEARNRIYLLGQWNRAVGASIEITDPYFTGAEGTKQCYRVLQTCISNLVDELGADAKG